MKKTTEAVKKEFDSFIRSHVHRPKNKCMDVLEPYWRHIRKAIISGIAKKKVYEFLIAQGIEVKFSAFCSLLRQKNLTKKCKDNHESKS